jgi:uncharacterized protein (TIGR02145 family)
VTEIVKILKYILLAIVLTGFEQIALSQYYLKAKSDSISLESDSVFLYVDGYRGAVRWWVSPDLLDWMSVGRRNDTLGVRIDKSAYYRATITEGTCNPVASDTVFLIEKLTITNSNQFIVDTMGGVFLLPSGLKVKIPRGAVTGPKEIRVDIISSDSVNKLAAVHYPENISFLSGISVATDSFNFSKPIKIKVPLAGIDGLPVLFEFNNAGDSWYHSDETIIVGNGVMNVGVEEKFIEIILKGSDKKGTPKKAGSELSLNDIRSFFLELYGDIFLGEDYCRELGYKVLSESRDTTGSGGCTVITINEEINYWACDPPQKGTYGALELSPDCEPSLTGCPGNYKILRGKKIPINLKTEIGGLPLDYQEITVTPSGNINVNALNLRTDFNGNASFDLTGTAPGDGLVYLSVAFEYDLITIYASNNEGAEEQSYDHKEVIKECTINVSVYDTAEVMTSPAEDIICTSATVGGIVFDDNNDPVTERGVVINGSKIPSGSGEGSFSVTLPGLKPNTAYSVKTYATNLAGTAFGNEVVFSTLADNCVKVSSTVLKDTTCVCRCTVFTVSTNVISDENEMITERGVYFGTSDNPEITGTKYPSGSGTGSFIKMFTDLPDNTTYYVKGYAILSSDTTILGNQAIFSTGGTVTDIDGNVYKTIPIGTQIWMAENLTSTIYNDGTSIPYGVLVAHDAYCWYGNYEGNRDPYGALYNGYAVNTGYLCPAGWHVPSVEEAVTMRDYLISHGYNYDGTTTGNKIAKSLASPPSYWHSIWAGTYWDYKAPPGAPGGKYFFEIVNATCFSGLPGGMATKAWIFDEEFHRLGSDGYWWLSDGEFDLHYDHESFSIGYWGIASEGAMKSVRCVKDKK